MNAYASLARYYDSLTTDVPYGAFVDFYETIFRQYAVKPNLLLDLACGTGTLTGKLCERGYDVIAVDASPEMLSEAQRKLAVLEKMPLLLCQSMEELDLYGTVEAAICSLDGINYVDSETLDEVFHRVHLFTEPGGVFIFDINTPEKLRGLDGEVFVDENENVFCVWRAELTDNKNACFYGMDIFRKCKNMWQRSKEEHIEYIHEPEMLRKKLEKNGFCDINIYGELKLSPPECGEQRVFIACRRNFD